MSDVGPPDVVSAPLLEVRGLKTWFPIRHGLLRKTVGHVRAVDGVNLSIERGKTLALVGESGCGKTTVGRTILRLIEPAAGEILFEGRDLAKLGATELKPYRRQMQMIFQDPMTSLNPRMRVGDIIAEGLTSFAIGDSDVDRKKRVSEILEKVKLDPEHANRYPHEFSGGQRQRIGIARALAVAPKLLICDEAISALDVSIQAQMLNLLSDLQEELGLTYLFITHDLSVVRYLSDDVSVMYLGQIVEHGPTEQLFEAPRHPYTEGLLAAIPSADPARRRVEATVLGDVPSPANPPSGCRFHTRCPKAFDRCSSEEPELVSLDRGASRCFLSNSSSAD